MSNGSMNTVQASSAEAFADGIGINTHVDFSWTVYNNFAEVESAIAYLGVKTVRDSIDNPNDPVKFQELSQALGIKFDLFVSPGSAGFTQQLQWDEENANVISILEGPNESDNWQQAYDGQLGLPATELEQQALYSAVTSDPALSEVKLVQSSFGQLSTFASVGTSIASDAEYANAHVYFGTGNNPGAAGWIQHVDGLAKGIAPGEPLMITETGYYTMPGSSSGVDDTVQAKYILDLIFDEWQAGATQINLYELVDENADPNDTNDQYHFGMFNSDWTPKPAAIALHNLLTIMNESNGAATVTTLGTLTYGLSNMPSGGNSEVFQKSDGTYVLALWNDVRLSGPITQTDITVAPQTVTVTLGQTYNYIDVFDPLSGTAPIKTFENASTIQISVPDHPILVEMSQNALPTIATGPLIAATAETLSTPGQTVQVDGLVITDTSSGTVTVDISDSTGTLSITEGSATQTGHAVDVSGTLSQVNAALATLTYKAGSSTGRDAISVYALDGASLSSSQTIAVDVDATPVPPTDTGPVVVAPTGTTVSAGSTSAIGGVELEDAYAEYNMGSFYMRISDNKGLLSMKDWSGTIVSGSGTDYIVYQATYPNIVAAFASLTYTAPSTAGTDTISVTIYDQLGMNTTKTFTVTIAPVVAPASSSQSGTSSSSTTTSSAGTGTTAGSTGSTSGAISGSTISSSPSSPASGGSTTSSNTVTTAASSEATPSSTSETSFYPSTPSGTTATATALPVVVAPGGGQVLIVPAPPETIRLLANGGTTTVEGFVAGTGGNTLQFMGANASSISISTYHFKDVLWDLGAATPVLWNMQGGNVAAATMLGSNMDSFWQIGAVGDFGGTGYSDILWTPTLPGAPAVIWMDSGNGQVSTVVLSQFGGVPEQAWTGDFNDDGKTDILWDFGSAAPVLWLMNGAAVMSASFLGVNMPAGWQIAGVGDFAGNGYSDVLWTSGMNGAAYLWMMGPGGPVGVSLAGYGAVPGKAWIGDFTGDGKDDILWDFGSAAPVLWIMNGDTIASASYLGAAMPAGYHIVGVGDFGGTGLADVMWASDSGGPAYAWLTQANGQVAEISFAAYGGVPGEAFVGDFTSKGAVVSGGDGTTVVLPGVTANSLTANNIVAASTTRDYSAFSSGVTVSLATGQSSVVGDNPTGYTSILGTAYNDTLEGHQGASSAPSVLTGNGGSDTYLYRAGDGQVVVNNGVGSDNIAAGIVEFLGSTTSQNLWFQQSGSNLVIDVLGSSDRMTIDNWYGSGQAYAQVSEIEASNLKLDTQLATLVQAMATFSAGNPSFNPEATGAIMPSDSTLQGVIAASWHS